MYLPVLGAGETEVNKTECVSSQSLEQQNLLLAWRTAAKPGSFEDLWMDSKFLPTQCLQSTRCDGAATQVSPEQGASGPRHGAESLEKAQAPSNWDEQGLAPGGRSASGRTWALRMALGPDGAH